MHIGDGGNETLSLHGLWTKNLSLFGHIAPWPVPGISELILWDRGADRHGQEPTPSPGHKPNGNPFTCLASWKEKCCSYLVIFKYRTIHFLHHH